MTGAIVIVAALTGLIQFWPRIARAELWRATITPLASIIGSGFLVLGPILNARFGLFAPLAMAGLCALAWAFGGAVRFNIARIARRPARTGGERGLERAAELALALAYIVSVAYYLNLFGAFATSLSPWESGAAPRLVASAIFLLILAVGWSGGFSALEWLEEASVGLKLAIVAGLALHFGRAAGAGGLIVSPPEITGWGALTLLFGLIVTVQGFETSRYLGDEYGPDLRIRSMKLAQGLSAAIYLVYIVLLTYAFAPDAAALTETAIISMMVVVAPIVPVMLVVAALSAQFSAAVADTGGAGGLFEELSGRRIAPRQAYAGLVALGLVLTWAADVFEIIAFASRAFALYYALQCAIAALGARAEGQGVRAAWYTALAALGLAITAFGVAVEA